MIIIQGLFTGTIGVGTWKKADGTEKGTWTTKQLVSQFGGLYAGKYGDGSEIKGDFALLAKDDGTVWINSGDRGSNHNGSLGQGTIDANGVITFSLTSGDGGTVTGNGHITTQSNVVEGTWSDTSGGTGTFRGSRAQPDTSLMQ